MSFVNTSRARVVWRRKVTSKSFEVNATSIHRATEISKNAQKHLSINLPLLEWVGLLMLETLVRRSCSSFCTWPFFSSSAGARGERAAWIYRQTTRLRCNCDNGGSRIDVNSGLMADFIDFTIDDQNAVLAGVSIGLEWELITPDREPSTWWFHVRVSLFAFHACNPIGGSKCKSNVSFAGVCACVCVCLGEHICVIQCNLFSLTVVRCSQVVRGLMTPVTWEKKEKQGCFFFVFFHGQF